VTVPLLRERAIDKALGIAEDRFGLGYGQNAPGWVRDRVLTVLEVQAHRLGKSLSEAVDELARDRAAIEELLTALRVGETRFYRDRSHWEALARDLIAAIPASTEITALSAGCSTGEEAYTLAMLLSFMKRRCRVVGVDRSGAAIAAARAGVYAADATRDVPSPWMTRFFEPVPGGLRVRSEIRSAVTFEECDLVLRVPRGPFHFVFFKNVLLYLAAPAGEAVAARLAAELDPRGLLFVSSSEVSRLRPLGLTPVRVAAGLTGFRRGAPP
jgi:chemotaxis protein methyltransferase CheR